MGTNATSAGRRALRRVWPAVLAFIVAGGVLLAAIGAVRIGGTTVGGERNVVDTQAPGTSPQERDLVAADSDLGGWYESRWVIGGSAIGVIVLLFVIVRWRTAYLERRRRDLETIAAERTREVEQQKQTLETYNQELLRTNEVLRQTVEEKSRLLGVAAHDLKNPLFGVRALSEIVLESRELSDKNERKLNLIHDSASEALHLIDNLLASAASAGQPERNFEPVDLSALVQWIVRSFEPQAERKQQGLRCRVATSESCVVEGDKQKLREAINNLVSNALKYSPPGADVELVVDRRNGRVRVDVIDAGPGLSETDQQRMFAPFQRLSPEPTGGEGSSGLGLYIVKQIAEMHEGTVDVDTELGDGSTFTLVLPGTDAEGAVPELKPDGMKVGQEG